MNPRSGGWTGGLGLPRVRSALNPDLAVIGLGGSGLGAIRTGAAG